jgi:predicted metal-binding protein
VSRDLTILNQVCATVLLPASLVVLLAEWMLLAIARGLYAVWRDSQGHHVLLGGLRSTVAQPEVVLLAAALIAVAFDGDVNVRMRSQKLSVLRVARGPPGGCPTCCS